MYIFDVESATSSTSALSEGVVGGDGAGISVKYSSEETASDVEKLPVAKGRNNFKGQEESHTVAKRLFQELEGNNSRKRDSQRLSLSKKSQQARASRLAWKCALQKMVPILRHPLPVGAEAVKFAQSASLWYFNSKCLHHYVQLHLQFDKQKKMNSTLQGASYDMGARVAGLGQRPGTIDGAHKGETS